VVGIERAVLIDTGMGIGNIKQEVGALTELPVIVVNTHNHFDHTGDNHRFTDVWAFDDDYEVAHIEHGHPRSECANYMLPSSYMNLPDGFNPSTYAIQPSHVTRRLHHLETIDLGERKLQVHHTPGHSPGSICLLDSRDRLLFTGDTVYPGTLIAHLEGANFEAYLNSLNYLGSLLDKIQHFCPAHNEVYAPKEMLTHMIEAFKRIASNKAEFEIQGATRLYRFEEFGVRLFLTP
jgi:glyoxylase-like metal-dependent hydrolase (beta-lactamase superfamily II)